MHPVIQKLLTHKICLYLFLLAFQLLILVLPLVFIPNIFNPYELPKFIFFAVTAELLAIFFALYWLLSKKKEVIFPKIDLGVIFVLSFGIINLISDLFGLNPITSILGNDFRHQGFITLLSGIVIFFLLRSPLLSQKMLPVFRKTAIVSAFLISLFALWQVVQINIFHNYTIATYNDRIVGTLGNPNFLGGYMAMLLPFALWYRQKINKLLRLITILAITLTVFYTDSASSFIAITVLLIIYLVRIFLFTKIGFSKIKSAVILILIFCIGSAITIPFISKNFTLSQSLLLKDEERCFENWPDTYPLKTITDIRKTGNVFFKRDSPCDSRFLIWIGGLNALGKNPILGIGQDNFEFIIPKGLMYTVDNAHNIFLETAVSSGTIGLLLYLLILSYAFRKSSFDIKMSLLAFVIIGQFNPLSIAQISLFWILLGLSQKENSKQNYSFK